MWYNVIFSSNNLSSLFLKKSFYYYYVLIILLLHYWCPIAIILYIFILLFGQIMCWEEKWENGNKWLLSDADMLLHSHYI